jgi:hypothetical protein
MTCTVLLAIVSLGACNGLAGDDEMERYFQRSDSITLSAGDAKQVNAVTHTIHPWPRGVGDRRIVYDARRVGSAVNRYSTTTRPVDQLPDISEHDKAMGQAPPITRNVNVDVSGSGAGSSGTAVSVGAGPGEERESN